MSSRVFIGALVVLGMLANGGAWWSTHGGGGVSLIRPASAAAVEVQRSAITPLSIPQLNPQRVALGKRLFFDPVLSSDGKVACSSCHDLARGGADGRARSVGVHGEVGQVNAPTVYNTGLNFRQFWDGRAATLEAQIDGPVHNSAELASSWSQILPRLERNPAYRAQFATLYGSVSEATVKDALATFERSLVSVDSRFDRYLRGDRHALTADEEAGYARFNALGCASCHQGANLGGNMYETLGVMGDYFADRGHVTTADLGLYNVTKKEDDRYKFRVPSLRLAVLTAPYFHDGSARTLEEAIEVMAHYQLGRRVTARDKALIIQFLHTLPGRLVSNEHG